RNARTNIMKKQFWLKRGKAAQIPVRRGLDNRTVFCANCEVNRTLGISSAGYLSCSSCGSGNWMYLFAPVIREDDEREEQECIAIDKYIQTLKHEVFFTSNGTLV